MKADIIQIEILEKNVDIDKISFKQSVLLFSKYLQKVVEENFKLGSIDKDFYFIINEILEYPDKFFTGTISSSEFYQVRINAWSLHDAEINLLKKRIIRAAICCLYEEYSESNDRYEVNDMIELFFSVLLDINEQYCYQFRVFFEQSLANRI